MKYIILAAGKGQESLQEEKNLPKCLIPFNEDRNIIDNILEIAKDTNIKDVNIIGGYNILEIMKSYPQLKYFYNEKWEETNSLYSLSKIIDYVDEDILISYSDTLYTKETIYKILENTDTLNVVYDSYWEKRYEGNKYNNDEIEKIYKNNTYTKEDLQSQLLGEFTGLLFIPKHEIIKIKILIKQILNENINASILNFLDHISKLNIEINLIDIKGNWAELDSIQDVEHFSFGTKAETLRNLKDKIKLSHVLNQISFTVEEFEKNSNTILKKIQTTFDEKLLVARSSAINEDTYNSSMAGNYESILKIEKDNNEVLKDAIEKVIESYKKNNQEQDSKNQILIQPYLENVSMSGVVFTKNLQTNSPYYTINYDESDDTEAVTSGNGRDLNTFICYRNAESKILNKKLEILINAVKEIENTTKYDAIDIEFAFIENELYILQARPIAAKKNSLKVLESDIDKEISSLKDFIKNKNDNQVNLVGNKIAYGVMPDWNPAEIVGINPKPLAFDLYKYIITDNIWAQSRKELGYRDVKNANGLVSFSGKPYVDIKMSFNTFIPKDIKDSTASKLVNFFIEELKLNPSQHDKVEFSVVITAFDFLFDEKMTKLKANGFDDLEINEIIKSYKKLTEDIVTENTISIDEELKKADILNKRREEILKSEISIPAKIYNLLEDCKTYGTLPFAKLARCGFIGSIFLKSLLEKDSISSKEYDIFMKSIHTIAKTFVDDLELLHINKIKKDEFLKKYGHLRPGTYDITSSSYETGFDHYIQVNPTQKQEIKKPLQNSKTSDVLEKVIKDNIAMYDLNFDAKELLNFIVKATEARELSKFEFTKNLSIVLDLISEFTSFYNISNEDASYINLEDILKLVNSSRDINIKKELENTIDLNKRKHLISTAIHLPELIFDIKDTEMFFYSQLKPNFISHHNIVGEVVKLVSNSKQDITNKIVMIENADPGFDWIFSHEIKGLITKYGGAASHMSIRCAEFDLPAAIGCGDKIFNELEKYNKISLDCSNQIVKGL